MRPGTRGVCATPQMVMLNAGTVKDLLDRERHKNYSRGAQPRRRSRFHGAGLRSPHFFAETTASVSPFVLNRPEARVKWKPGQERKQSTIAEQ